MNKQHNTAPPKNTPAPIRQHLATLLTSKLAKASALTFVATIGGGVLGYVFQILMGRMLSVSEYGQFVTLFALLYVVGVPIGTLGMVVSRRASEYLATSQPERMAAMFWWVNRRVLWIALATVLCTAPFTPWLSDYFHVGSAVTLWIFLLLVITLIFGPINLAFLQAQQNFRWLAINILATHGFRMICCAVLVYIGLKLNGALAGLILASLAAWFLSYLPLRDSVSQSGHTTPAGEHLSFRGSFIVLIANLSFTVMTQLDIILVNHYYNTYQAGVYAAAAMLGKAVIHFPGAISIAMFPMVAENKSRDQSSAHIFFNAMVLTACLSGAGTLCYFLFADNIITLFYGEKYQGAAELLKLYGFAMLPMTLILVAENFLIAKGQVIFAFVMILGLPFVLFAAQNNHAQLIDMVYILAACGWGLAIVGFGVIGVQYWWGRKRDISIAP